MTFWAGAPMRSDALAWVGLDGSILGAPAIFGALADLLHVDGLRDWPALLFTTCREWLGVTRGDEAAGHRSYALGSVIGGVLVPIVFCGLGGPRTKADLGLRRPAASFLPILLLALALITPLALAMSLHPVFREGLAARAQGSPWFLLSVLVGGLSEHFFFHGVLLAWLHPSGVLPPAPTAPLLWPGRRREDGARATVGEALSSLAIPRASVGACLLSAPLFFAIHAGQSAPELWLSAPAGIVFAWLAYRTGGFVLPMLLHLSVSLLAALLVGVAALVS